MPLSNEVERQLKSIEALVHKIETTSDPTLSVIARELAQSLMQLHGAGLERILEIIEQTSPSSGASTIEALGADELVRSLLLLYGLHPDSLEKRVIQAIEKVRPNLQSHGGNVQLIGVDDSGAITLRVGGKCHGCGSSPAKLLSAVEEAICEAAPDATAIEVQGSIEDQSNANAFIPLSQLSSGGHSPKAEYDQAALALPLSKAGQGEM